MAGRKLSLRLFSAKGPVSASNGGSLYLHFVERTQHDRNQYAIVCESQPLMTFRSHGFPGRCPFCGVQNPWQENAISKDNPGRVAG